MFTMIQVILVLSVMYIVEAGIFFLIFYLVIRGMTTTQQKKVKYIAMQVEAWGIDFFSPLSNKPSKLHDALKEIPFIPYDDVKIEALKTKIEGIAARKIINKRLIICSILFVLTLAFFYTGFYFTNDANYYNFVVICMTISAFCGLFGAVIFFDIYTIELKWEEKHVEEMNIEDVPKSTKDTIVFLKNTLEKNHGIICKFYVEKFVEQDTIWHLLSIRTLYDKYYIEGWKKIIYEKTSCS